MKGDSHSGLFYGYIGLIIILSASTYNIFICLVHGSLEVYLRISFLTSIFHLSHCSSNTSVSYWYIILFVYLIYIIELINLVGCWCRCEIIHVSPSGALPPSPHLFCVRVTYCISIFWNSTLWGWGGWRCVEGFYPPGVANFSLLRSLLTHQTVFLRNEGFFFYFLYLKFLFKILYLFIEAVWWKLPFVGSGYELFLPFHRLFWKHILTDIIRVQADELVSSPHVQRILYPHYVCFDLLPDILLYLMSLVHLDSSIPYFVVWSGDDVVADWGRLFSVYPLTVFLHYFLPSIDQVWKFWRRLEGGQLQVSLDSWRA